MHQLHICCTMRNFSAAGCGKVMRGNLRNIPHLIFSKLPIDNFTHSTIRKIHAPMPNGNSIGPAVLQDTSTSAQTDYATPSVGQIFYRCANSDLFLMQSETRFTLFCYELLALTNVDFLVRMRDACLHSLLAARDMTSVMTSVAAYTADMYATTLFLTS